MRRFFLSLIFVLATLFLRAQSDVTKFLGIPVDGPKHEMITRLQQRGFERFFMDGKMYLTGKYNGEDVRVEIVTTNNKVSHILVLSHYLLTASGAKKIFNNLCRQYSNNSNYVSLMSKYSIIPQEENISYEMRVHNKIYGAFFHQKCTTSPLELEKIYNHFFYDNYTEKQILAGEAAAHIQHLKRKIVTLTILEQENDGYYIAICYENGYNSGRYDNTEL